MEKYEITSKIVVVMEDGTRVPYEPGMLDEPRHLAEAPSKKDRESERDRPWKWPN